MGVTNAGIARCGVERLPFRGGPRFFFWLAMGTRRTTDVRPRLLRHRHVELDRRELLGRLADAKRFNIQMPKDLRMTTTERAYTSPIWYTP